jgi:hypothetical protein
MTQQPVALPDAATVAAYESTHYYAHDTQPVLLRIGDAADLHRDWLSRMNAGSATILTAWNPLGKEVARAENDLAQDKLLADIRSKALRWLPASGEDPAGAWQPEPGFCVFDASDEVVDQWLVAFRQNAAVRVTREDNCRLVWHPSLRSG